VERWPANTADDVIFTFDVLYDPKWKRYSREELMLDVPGKDGKSTRQPIKYPQAGCAHRRIFVFPFEYAVRAMFWRRPSRPNTNFTAHGKPGNLTRLGRYHARFRTGSSGPWILSEYRSGQARGLQAQPELLEKDAQDGSLPYLDQRVLLIVRNITTLTSKFRAKEPIRLAFSLRIIRSSKKAKLRATYRARSGAIVGL
jgi:ABC-type transport system substrate-binding protein